YQCVSVGADKRVVWWDIGQGDEVRVLDGTEGAEGTCGAISHSGEWFAVGDRAGTVVTYGYDSGEVEKMGVLHTDGVSTLAISDLGDVFATGGKEGGIVLWEA
ncbi:WD40-repeat-containing domain, partial [Aduncisulcus paluster]